jgi:uncharacterized alkaline shock family protein YloU
MSETELADSIAAATLAVPGVAALHPGMFGEVGTYLPGRRVTGVRVTDGTVDVHVTVHEGVDVRRTAAAVRDAVVLVAPGSTVDVTVEDVAPAVRP